MPGLGKRGFQRCALARVSICQGECTGRLSTIGPALGCLAVKLQEVYKGGVATFQNGATFNFSCEELGRRHYDFTPSLKWCSKCCATATKGLVGPVAFGPTTVHRSHMQPAGFPQRDVMPATAHSAAAPSLAGKSVAPPPAGSQGVSGTFNMPVTMQHKPLLPKAMLAATPGSL